MASEVFKLYQNEFKHPVELHISFSIYNVYFDFEIILCPIVGLWWCLCKFGSFCLGIYWKNCIFLNNKSIVTNTSCAIETFNKMCLELNLEMKTLERSRNCHNNNANFIIWQMKMNPKNADEMCQNKQNKFQEKWEVN